MKSIFVSHVFENNKFLGNLKKWEKKKLIDDYTFTFETEDKRNEGEKEIKKYLTEKIRGCSALLVLIGDDTHNHDWIKKEVEFANSFHKQIICMRIPSTEGSKPEILKKHEEIVFDPKKLLKVLQ